MLNMNFKQTKKIWKIFQKFFKKNLFLLFFCSKTWNGGEFKNLMPETESRNKGDHELWNHEMWGSPVVSKLQILKNWLEYGFKFLVILPCFHVPWLTVLNLSCICTAISVARSVFHASFVILSTWNF